MIGLVVTSLIWGIYSLLSLHAKGKVTKKLVGQIKHQTLVFLFLLSSPLIKMLVYMRECLLSNLCIRNGAINIRVWSKY